MKLDSPTVTTKHKEELQAAGLKDTFTLNYRLIGAAISNRTFFTTDDIDIECASTSLQNILIIQLFQR